jgi:hypothetical protein
VTTQNQPVVFELQSLFLCRDPSLFLAAKTAKTGHSSKRKTGSIFQLPVSLNRSGGRKTAVNSLIPGILIAGMPPARRYRVTFSKMRSSPRGLRSWPATVQFASGGCISQDDLTGHKNAAATMRQPIKQQSIPSRKLRGRYEKWTADVPAGNRMARKL